MHKSCFQDSVLLNVKVSELMQLNCESCHQILCTCIEKGLKQLRIKLVQLDVGRGLVALHMLMEQMRPRLQSILDMCCSRPHAVEALSVGAAGPCAELLGVPDEMVCMR